VVAMRVETTQQAVAGTTGSSDSFLSAARRSTTPPAVQVQAVHDLIGRLLGARYVPLFQLSILPSTAISNATHDYYTLSSRTYSSDLIFLFIFYLIIYLIQFFGLENYFFFIFHWILVCFRFRFYFKIIK
jgi:hypothetical protein